MTKYEEIIEKHDLTPLEEPVLDMQWKARFGDWYAKTQSGWFWYDAVAKVWKLQANGPS